MIQNSKVWFRYRLSDNSKHDRENINGIDLTKEWITFSNEQLVLKNQIRTKDNPENVVDYEKFDGTTHAVLKSSWVDFKKFMPYYSRETLASMPRNQLEMICSSYNITTANMLNKFLVNKILEKQEIFKSKTDEEKEKKRKELLNEVAEKAAQKIVDETIKNIDIKLDPKEIKEQILNELESKEESDLKKNF